MRETTRRTPPVFETDEDGIRCRVCGVDEEVNADGLCVHCVQDGER